MLVLSRKQEQTVWIGKEIRITILKSNGSAVRLGIEAPHDVTILRDELVPEHWMEAEAISGGTPMSTSVAGGNSRVA